jgi:hypothetical protein
MLNGMGEMPSEPFMSSLSGETTVADVCEQLKISPNL